MTSHSSISDEKDPNRLSVPKEQPATDEDVAAILARPEATMFQLVLRRFRRHKLAFASVIIFIPSTLASHVWENALANNSSGSTAEFTSPEGVIFMKVWIGFHMTVAAILIILCIPVFCVIHKELKLNKNMSCMTYKSTFMLSSVLLYFVVSHIPLVMYFYVPSIFNAEFDTVFMIYFVPISNILTYSGGLVNPFMYGMCSKSFWRDAAVTCSKNTIYP